MRRIACLVGAAVLALGCADRAMSLAPTIFVDRDLGEAMPEVLAAIASWSDVHPSLVVAPHAEVVALATDNDLGDTIYIVATDDLSPAGCPHATARTSSAAQTTRTHGGASAITCISLSYLSAHPIAAGSSVRRATAHEVGHALGLEHCDEHGELWRLMSAAYDGPDAPTSEDASSLRALHHVDPK